MSIDVEKSEVRGESVDVQDVDETPAQHSAREEHEEDAEILAEVGSLG